MLSRYDPIRLQSDFAIFAYFDAVAIAGIEALKSHFQVVFRLIIVMLSAIAAVPLPGRLPQNFHSPKENVPSAQIAIRFIKSYHVQTQEAAQASQRFRVS